MDVVRLPRARRSTKIDRTPCCNSSLGGAASEERLASSPETQSHGSTAPPRKAACPLDSCNDRPVQHRLFCGSTALGALATFVQLQCSIIIIIIIIIPLEAKARQKGHKAKKKRREALEALRGRGRHPRGLASSPGVSDGRAKSRGFSRAPREVSLSSGRAPAKAVAPGLEEAHAKAHRELTWA